MTLTRRDLLGLGLLGTAALYLPVERLARAADFASTATLPRPFTLPFLRPPDIDLRAAANGGTPVGRIQLTMRPVTASVLGAAPASPQTPLWAYVGPAGQVNPTLHVDSGQPLELTQVNALPDRHPAHGYESWASVHLHGSASLPQHDGYANDVIRPGQRKTYRYPNAQAARTLWYHDHAVHRSARNTYAGLAAQYHIHDELEAAAGIPTGAYDIPLTLRDALFRKDGSLLYDDNGESSLMGDAILVNGVPWPVLPVAKRRYRFRILNAAVSRAFALSLSDPRARMWVIATDAGFVPTPIEVAELRMGSGERYEVVVDFAACADGAEVVLRNGDLPNNVAYLHTNKVMKFAVAAGRAPDLTRNEIPSSFYAARAPRSGAAYITPEEVMGLTPAMAVARRTLRFDRGNGVWQVNGTTWDDVVRSGFRRVQAEVTPNAIEIWDFVNEGGGWAHPVHLHLIDFKLLSRNGRPPRSYEAGPKDVAYVGENETVRVVAKFGPHEGRYMIHCHNVVHEDHDMMTQYRIGPDRGTFPSDPNDPVNAAPAA